MVTPTKRWNDYPLEDPDPDDLKAEIRNITATLMELHSDEVSPRALRSLGHRAVKPRFRVRKLAPVEETWRKVTADDLCHDFEIAAVALKNSRMVQGAITKGLKDAGVI